MTSNKSAMDPGLPTHYIRPTLGFSLMWSARIFAAGALCMWGIMQVTPSFSIITSVSWSSDSDSLRPFAEPLLLLAGRCGRFEEDNYLASTSVRRTHQMVQVSGLARYLLVSSGEYLQGAEPG